MRILLMHNIFLYEKMRGKKIISHVHKVINYKQVSPMI